MSGFVVAAHPDDEIHGGGGTVACLVAEGASVSIPLPTESLAARTGFDETTQGALPHVHHDTPRLVEAASRPLRDRQMRRVNGYEVQSFMKWSSRRLAVDSNLRGAFAKSATCHL